MEAIILAGGLGTRLRSVVSEVPKCMAPVAGKPFLWYLLTYLARYPEVGRVVLSVGYLREVIFDWVRSVAGQFPFPIDYAVEEVPLGTGGGIRLALSKCMSDDVLVLNGDTMFDVDLRRLFESHVQHPDAAVTLSLRQMQQFDRYGRVSMDASQVITCFHEKQYCEDGLINGGVYLIRRSRLDLSALPERFSFEKEVFEPHVQLRDLYGYVSDGFFIDIGIPEDYQRAQFEFLARYCSYDTLLLDRDGTINVRRPNDYVKTWQEFQFRPEFLRWASLLGHTFRRVFIVTNQRGIGRGVMTEEALHDIHGRMCKILSTDYGLHVDDIFYATGVDDTDPRRKPQAGMWQALLEAYPDVQAERTVMIGDGDVDEAFARNCHLAFVRV